MTHAFEKEGLSVTEASEIAGIGRTKIYEAISDGRIKARKLGKRTLILRSDLHGFLQELPTVESVVVKPTPRNVEVAIASASGQRQQKKARRGANQMKRDPERGGGAAPIKLLAPVHDAVLIEAPVDRIEADVVLMQEIMRRASRIVLNATVEGTHELRTDANIIRYPARYSDKRGDAIWDHVLDLLAKREQQAKRSA